MNRNELLTSSPVELILSNAGGSPVSSTCAIFTPYLKGFFLSASAFNKQLLIFFVLFAGSICSDEINAQEKQTQSINQIWIGYFNQSRFADKWGIWADLHLRTKEDFISGLSQAIVRLGLTYYIKDDVKLTAGYAYINHFPSENHKNISQPEHRPWQQIQWHTRYPKLRLMQWFRLEERYRRKILNDDKLDEGYSFNFRIRYNFFSQFPLNKKYFQPGTLSFVVNDEVLINFGKQIINNYFDQNRFFVGFVYHVNTHDNIQFGYMNVFQQLAAGNRYRSSHVARLFYFHNLVSEAGKNKKDFFKQRFNTMARIPPVSDNELQPSVQVAFERHIKEYNARITNMKATLGYSVLAFEIYMQWYPLYEEVEKILGKRLAYLFAYSISRAGDCPLCTTFFRKIIIDAGEKPENLALTPSQIEILDFGSGIAKHQGNISDHLYDTVAERYSKRDMVILIAFAGQMIATNVFNNVIETDIDEYLGEYLPALK